MVDAESESSSILGSIRTQLEGLKRTEDGMLLYRLIERGLGKRPGDGSTDEAFLTFLYTLLERYAKNRDGDPITRIKVRVIQQRITPHLLGEKEQPAPPPVVKPATDPEEIVEAEEPELEIVEDLAEDLKAAERGDVQAEQVENPDQTTVELNLPIPSIDKPEPEEKKKTVSRANKQEPAKAKKKSDPPKKPIKLELVDPTDLTKPHVDKKSETDEGYDIELGGDADSSKQNKKAATRIAPVSRKAKKDGLAAKKSENKSVRSKGELMPRKAGLKKKAVPAGMTSNEPSQERVEKLHEAFVHKMAESITRSQEYHRLLKSHMKAIELAGNENDFKDLQTLLVRGMADLLKGNEALGRDLDSTSHYLKIARLDRALLKDELGRIKDNTTVDELTALQNREAFLKQLDSEISRVNRYGFSFAIAVLDIDDLKAINTSNGRDAGDEVLRCYARQILSQFRSYDLVARNKSDEFLLLFPNTQKEGAIRAMEKAQKHAASLYINHKDKNIKVPSFTSVLTTYTPGDQPETILKRTTDALAQAQKHGRDQIIVALPTA